MKTMSASPRSAFSTGITAFLRHPAVMRIKHAVRELRWRLTRTAPVNPPIPPEVRSLLFVCLGNICRSPFAGLLARRQLDALGRSDVLSVSAGIRTTQAKRSPREACEAAAAYGLELESHRPLQLTDQLMDAADMVIVMEVGQLAQLRSAYPKHHGRIFLLSLLDAQASRAYERDNIEDPFGRPLAAFHHCYGRINRALGGLIGALPRP
jgi:protein-tyrosine phosphatase